MIKVSPAVTAMISNSTDIGGTARQVLVNTIDIQENISEYINEIKLENRFLLM